MRAIWAEFGKIRRSRLVLFMLVVLLGANFFCLFDSMRQESFTASEYTALWQKILQRPAGERLDYARTLQEELQQELRESGLFYTRELVLCREVVAELNAENSYREYVEELGRKKDLITGSVLFRGKSAFSTKSAEKAYVEYINAKAPVIAEAPSKGVALVTLTVTDLLAACAGIFACVVLFVREREQDMVRLQWTLRRGRLQHLGYKVGALFLCSGVLALLFYGSNYLVAAFRYGLGPLNRDIRMVADYAHSIHGFSVGTWLVLNLFLKIVVLFVILLLCSICCTVLNGMVSVVLSFTAILLTEYLLYSGIAATSVYSPLRYINLIALFQNDEWLLHYKHINVFGHPVNYAVCVAGMIVLVFFLAVVGCCLGYLSYGRKMEHHTSVRRIRRKKAGKVNGNLFRLELWKALIMQRLLPMIAGLLVLQVVYYVRSEKPGVSAEEYYYKAFMTRLEGEITEKTPEILAELYEAAVETKNSMALGAYARIEERYRYLQEHGGCFVYDTGFGVLCGTVEKNRDVMLTLKIMLVILLFSASVFCYDPQKRMDGLLHSTVKGEKKVPLCKYVICAVFSLLVGMAVYLPDYLQVVKYYEVHGFSYPAVSLPWLMSYGASVSIGGYLVLLYTVRLLLCPVSVVFFMAAAERIKSFVYTFFACGIVVLCIPLLANLNSSWIVLSYPLYGLYGNVLLQGSKIGIVVYFGLLTGAVCWTWKGRKRLWN